MAGRIVTQNLKIAIENLMYYFLLTIFGAQ